MLTRRGIVLGTLLAPAAAFAKIPGDDLGWSTGFSSDYVAGRVWLRSTAWGPRVRVELSNSSMGWEEVLLDFSPAVPGSMLRESAFAAHQRWYARKARPDKACLAALYDELVREWDARGWIRK